jgi:hypothetical protein
MPNMLVNPLCVVKTSALLRYALPATFKNPPILTPPDTIKALGELNPKFESVDKILTEFVLAVNMVDHVRIEVDVEPISTLPLREGNPKSGSA